MEDKDRILIEVDNWAENIIKGIPAGINKPKYYEPIAWHKFVKVDDLIQAVEDLSDEVDRLTTAKSSPIVLDREFLNIVEEISNELGNDYVDIDSSTTLKDLYVMVEDLYKAYIEKDEELENTIQEREEYYMPRRNVNPYI